MAIFDSKLFSSVRNIRKRGITTNISWQQVDYRNCYRVLGLPENCTQEELRTTFIRLAKKYHPDSNQESDAAKFQLVENAYRTLQEKFNSDIKTSTLNTQEEISKSKQNSVEHDIEHTAPQHRQFLNYEGIGQGTPFQREKQYQKYQVKKAVENVYNHRVSQLPCSGENTLILKETKAAKKVKTKYGIDRLVEDLIQESMAKGEFTNLKGNGKPLQNQNHNPYIDVVTHKINQILIENGFSPQWVMLEKEIRSEISNVKQRLQERRKQLGRTPLSTRDRLVWNTLLDTLKDDVKQINKKINDYNLIVPLLNKQMVHTSLAHLSERCLMEQPSKLDLPPDQKNSEKDDDSNKRTAAASQLGLFSLLSSFWKGL